MDLFFRRFGQGFPVIILHGLFGISDNWVSFARELSADFEVFVPDLRNHGQSPHSGLFNFEALAGDLDEFIGTHGLENPVIIGHSLGGKTAMLYTLEHPERVKKLVVVDISPRRYPPNPEHHQLIVAMQAVDFSQARSRFDVERQLEPMVPSRKLRQFLLKNVYRRNTATLDWRLNLPALQENLPEVFQSVLPEKAYPGPTLFVRGALSPYILDTDLTLIRRHFPSATVATVPGASHWVHADTPAEFYRIVAGFLKCSE